MIDYDEKGNYYLAGKGCLGEMSYEELADFNEKYMDGKEYVVVKILNNYFFAFTKEDISESRDIILDECFGDYWNLYKDYMETEGVKPSTIIYFIYRELDPSDFKYLCVYFKTFGVDCIELLKEEISSHNLTFENDFFSIDISEAE